MIDKLIAVTPERSNAQITNDTHFTLEQVNALLELCRQPVKARHGAAEVVAVYQANGQLRVQIEWYGGARSMIYEWSRPHAAWLAR